MASNLNDSIPQWKKDLILRKRAQNKCSATVNKQNSEQLLFPTAGVTGCSDAGSTTIVPDCVTPTQASQTKSSLPVSFEQHGDIHVSEKCDKISFVNKTKGNFVQKTMVQDSVLLVHKPIQSVKMVTENVPNGNHFKSDADSDSSEELQYGPGIVSKLKSKYLSLTLREKKVAKPRQTILNMRRATSLENMLDADSADEQTETSLNEKNAKPVTTQSRKFTPRTENLQNGNARNTGTRYRSTSRTNESMKRARSVETLHVTDTTNVNNKERERERECANEDVVIIEKEGNTNQRKWQDNKTTVQSDNKSFTCNGSQMINRPKRIMPILDETERPPADHVKQTMMLFEGPPVRRTKGPRPTGEVAAKVASYKNIIEKEKNNKKNNVKPQITPKPVGHNKTRKVFNRTISPKIDSNVNDNPVEKLRSTSPLSPTGKRTPSPTGKVSPLSPVDKRPLSPLEKVRPLSPVVRPLSPADKIKTTSPEKTKSSVVSPELRMSPVSTSPDVTSTPNQIPDVSRINEVSKNTGADSETIRTRILSDTPDLILHSSPIPQNLPSPTSVKKLTENFIKTEKKHSEPTSPPKVSQNGRVNSGSIRSPVEDACDGVTSKQINKQAMENIGKAGYSITFNISDNTPKSHLPRLSTVPVGINRLVPDTPTKPVTKPAPKPLEDKKKCEAINELVTQNKSQQKEIRSTANVNTSVIPTVNTPVTPPVNTTVVNKPKKDVIKNNIDIIPKNRPPTPVQNKNLTNREITKNYINSAKTFEQPVSKVVVSVRSVEEVVVNNSAPGFLGKSTKSRSQEQTSLLFNFQDRETVPDYIAHDSNVAVRRGKREKPKVISNVFKFCKQYKFT